MSSEPSTITSECHHSFFGLTLQTLLFFHFLSLVQPTPPALILLTVFHTLPYSHCSLTLIFNPISQLSSQIWPFSTPFYTHHSSFLHSHLCFRFITSFFFLFLSWVSGILAATCSTSCSNKQKSSFLLI